MSDLPLVHVVGAAILRDGACLAAQRGAAMSEPMKWEFPGGKVEAGEEPRNALRREIREELALDIAVGDWLGRGTSTVAGRRIALDVYLATWLGGEIRLAEHHAWGWFRGPALDRLDWAEADRRPLDALRQRLRSIGRGPQGQGPCHPA